MTSNETLSQTQIFKETDKQFVLEEQKALLKKAIEQRASRRSYTSDPILQSDVSKLNAIICEANAHPGARLHFQLVTGAKKAFSSFFKTYGLFSGVHSYIIAAGPKDDPKAQQLLGYYGELLVLTAQSMGLSSCWVGATYDKSQVSIPVNADEKLYCLITLGYAREKHSMGERLARSVMHRQSHTAGEIMEYHGLGQAPGWFMDGITAVLKAPSARNKLPVHFALKQGCVSAWATPNGGYENIDLGIAKLHFELGADYIFYDLRKK